MTYATQADLETRFGIEEILQLSDRANLGVADVSVIAAALADADNEIDGYVGVAYTLPLDGTPPILLRLACDMARFFLYKDRASDQIRQSYEDAVDRLKRIANGTLKLPVPDAAPEPVKAITATPASRVSAFTDTELSRML
jgi:phage gp36-like protein